MSFELLIATNNQHKLKEIREILTPHGIIVYGLSDLGIEADAEENGKNYYENALIKAREVQKHTSMPVIADDSGLEIEGMDNQPGIHSARYASSFGGHANAIAHIIDTLKDNPNKNARFICDIVMVNIKDEPLLFEGIVEGEIANAPYGKGGFGYDPIFICKETGITYAEMSEEEKNKASHRGKALNKMIDYLKRNGLAL